MKATLTGSIVIAGFCLLAMPACATHYPGAYHHGGGYGEYARGQEKAYDRGYHHGLKAGRKDWRKHRRFDPWRHSRYHHADSGYRSRYGPFELYSRTYRAGFRDGYRHGYGSRRGRHSRHGYAVPRR